MRVHRQRETGRPTGGRGRLAAVLLPILVTAAALAGSGNGLAAHAKTPFISTGRTTGVSGTGGTIGRANLNGDRRQPEPDQGRQRPCRCCRSRRLHLLVEPGNRRQQPRHHDRPREARRDARQSELHHRAEQPSQPRDQRQLHLLGQPLRQHDRPRQDQRHAGQLELHQRRDRTVGDRDLGPVHLLDELRRKRRQRRHDDRQSQPQRPRRQPELHHRRSRPSRNRRPRPLHLLVEPGQQPIRHDDRPRQPQRQRCERELHRRRRLTRGAHRQRHPHLLVELRRPTRHTRHDNRPRKPRRHRRQPALRQRRPQPHRPHRRLTGTRPTR